MDPIFHVIADGPKPVAPYSHVVEVGGWLFVTGQLATGRDPKEPLPAGIDAQTRKVMENLRILLTDFERDYARMNEIYLKYFNPNALPARTTVGVTHLARGGIVEIDLI